MATGIPVATWETETSETIASVIHILEQQNTTQRK